MKFVAILLVAVMAIILSAQAQPAYYQQIPVYRVARAADDNGRVQRQAGGDHHDVVDFGAHTGHHGAFGWYADFPVHSGN